MLPKLFALYGRGVTSECAGYMNNQQTTSPFKKVGLDVVQSHPLRRICFGQYQAPCRYHPTGITGACRPLGMRPSHTFNHLDLIWARPIGGSLGSEPVALSTSCIAYCWGLHYECLLPSYAHQSSSSFTLSRVVPACIWRTLMGARP